MQIPRRSFVVRVALLVCILACRLPGIAETSPLPSLKDTTEWIYYNLSSTTYTRDEQTTYWTSQTSKFRGCAFDIVRDIRARPNVSGASSATILTLAIRSGQIINSVDHELYGKELYGSTTGYRYHFSGQLTEFDPSRIEVRRVTFHHDSEVDGDSRSEPFALQIDSAKVVNFVVDESRARRLANAFRHAIELCGGRPDPF